MANWRDEYKSMEQAFMCERDRYSEVARALGFKGDAFFNDPLAPHEAVVARARELAGTATPQRCDRTIDMFEGVPV